MKKLIFGLIAFLLLPIGTVSAATASFYNSGGGVAYTGSTVSVTVYANASSSYNAVQVNVTFSNLTYLSASAASGWTGVSGPSRSGNTVSYSGALLGSSASGSKAVLTVSFRTPTSAGTSTVNSSGKVALANGEGTQINATGNTVTYTVTKAPAAPDPVPSKVKVTSSTHPSSKVWYNNKNVDLAWTKAKGVDNFSYKLDQKPNTKADTKAEGDETSKSYSELPEGYSYFHIRAHNNQGWGATAHFRINVDTTVPDPFAVAKLENETGDKYVLYFAANDSPSGIAYFSVKLDGVDVGKQVTKYEIEKSVGTVEVTAVDYAGNQRTATLVVNQTITNIGDTIQTSGTVDFKLIVLGLIILAVLGLLAIVVYIVWRNHKLNHQLK